MANTNAPFGFKENGVAGGGAAPTMSMVTRQIAYNNTTKIFHGDPVLNLDTGYIGQWVNGTAARLMAGIFNGCRYLSLSQGKVVYSNFWPGGDAAAGTVFADITPTLPGVPLQFIVQAASGPIVFADIGQTADVTVGTGSTITGISGASLANLGTTATQPFVVTGLYEGAGAGADAASAYNWVYVAFNSASLQGI